MLLSDYQWFAAAPVKEAPELVVRRLGLQDFEPLYKSMRYLVEHIDDERPDEIWLLSHKPVFTQGQAGKAEHILDPGNIPVAQIDRGGQVTYHGPGQLVVYLLLNVRRRKLSVRALVSLIENAITHALAEMGIASSTRDGAPGVYVNDAKIAALGLRIKNGWSYHGLSLNVRMDLQPFQQINPCGYAGLGVTEVAEFLPPTENLLREVSKLLCNHLLTELGYAAYYEAINLPSV